MQSRIHILQPDRYGRQGIAFDGATYRDLESWSTFTQERDMTLYPVLKEMQMQLAAIQAKTHAPVPAHYHHEHIVGDQLPPGQEEPQEDGAEPQPETLAHTTIGALLQKYAHTPRLHSILIGEYLDAGGHA